MNNSAIAWDELHRRYAELSSLLASSASLEASQRHLLQKEFSYLSTVISKHTEIEKLKAELAHIKSQVIDDPEIVSLFNEEALSLEGRISKEYQLLDALMYPPNPLDDRSVFVEIRAGTGGQEAALFAADLLRMYTLYAAKKGWRVSIVSESSTDLGGYREIVLHIEGNNVYGHLKHESGVHRVQRVPHTEGSGRIHTSTATVAVLPEAEEVEVTINPADLRIDVFRAGGAGGQHVNKTDSAVRITHIPSGLVVACQEDRSQHKNKAKALKMLQSRLLAAEQEKRETQMSQQRREQVGTGMRAEKVRTYNFPQNRITDHQVELTLKKLDMVLEGDLDDIIESLMKQEHEQRRKELPGFMQK
jgi:peptide chain release factor 1